MLPFSSQMLTLNMAFLCVLQSEKGHYYATSNSVAGIHNRNHKESIAIQYSKTTLDKETIDPTNPNMSEAISPHSPCVSSGLKHWNLDL